MATAQNSHKQGQILFHIPLLQQRIDTTSESVTRFLINLRDFGEKVCPQV